MTDEDSLLHIAKPVMDFIGMWRIVSMGSDGDVQPPDETPTCGHGGP